MKVNDFGLDVVLFCLKCYFYRPRAAFPNSATTAVARCDAEDLLSLAQLPYHQRVLFQVSVGHLNSSSSISSSLSLTNPNYKQDTSCILSLP